MKLPKIILTFLILSLASQICFTQQKTKALLLDEIGRTSCADLQNRVGSALYEVLKEPKSSGYVIIYGKKNDLIENLHYESWIKGYIQESYSDQNLIKVIRGEERDKLTVQVWKSPADADLKFFSEAEWSYELPKSTKPFIFARSLPDGGICLITPDVRRFADFLLNNQNVRGHLVIRDKTNRTFRNREKEILDELVNKYKVPHNRIKFFYIVDKNHPYNYDYIEFWLVPHNIKYSN